MIKYCPCGHVDCDDDQDKLITLPSGECPECERLEEKFALAMALQEQEIDTACWSLFC